uniref:Uncharacterized protein n=1 Tax=Arundo donax TaxID=35708 RepID=A0A0A9ATT9_ARUDO
MIESCSGLMTIRLLFSHPKLLLNLDRELEWEIC